MLSAPTGFLDVCAQSHVREVWIVPLYWRTFNWARGEAIPVSGGEYTLDSTAVAWRRASLRLAPSPQVTQFVNEGNQRVELWWGVRLHGEDRAARRDVKIATLLVQDIDTDDDGMVQVTCTDLSAMVDESDFTSPWPARGLPTDKDGVEYPIREVLTDSAQLPDGANVPNYYNVGDIIFISSTGAMWAYTGVGMMPWTEVKQEPLTVVEAIRRLCRFPFESVDGNVESAWRFVLRSDVPPPPPPTDLVKGTLTGYPNNTWPAGDQKWPNGVKATARWSQSGSTWTLRGSGGGFFDLECGYLMSRHVSVRDDTRQGVTLTAWVRLVDGKGSGKYLPKAMISPVVAYGGDAIDYGGAQYLWGEMCPSYQVAERISGINPDGSAPNGNSNGFIRARPNDWPWDTTNVSPTDIPKMDVPHGVTLKTKGVWRKVQWLMFHPPTVRDYERNFARYGFKVTDLTYGGLVVEFKDVTITTATGLQHYLDGKVQATAVFEGNRWEAVQKLADLADCDVYTDNHGQFVIGANSDKPDRPDWLVDSSVVKVSPSQSRSERYNGVVMTTNAGGLGTFVRVSLDTDRSSDTFWGGPFGKKPLAVTNDVVVGASAGEIKWHLTAAAESKLRNVRMQSVSVDVESLVNPLLTPRDRVDVTVGGEAMELRVDSLTVDLDAASMRLTCKLWGVS